jgi:hypothetical protein
VLDGRLGATASAYWHWVSFLEDPELTLIYLFRQHLLTQLQHVSTYRSTRESGTGVGRPRMNIRTGIDALTFA